MKIFSELYMIFQSHRSARSKKLLLTLLSYFLIVLLIPMIVGSIAYSRSVGFISHEVQSTKMQMLHQASRAIDTQLLELQRLALQTATNYYILDFLSSGSFSDEDTIFKATHVIREIATLKNANNFIEDIFVYSKNMDVVINANSVYHTDFFFSNSYTYQDMPYEGWLNRLSDQVNYNTYWAAERVQVDGIASHNIITYVQSIPIAERYSPYGCVVILINEDNLLSPFEEIAADGAAIILNSENRIVAEGKNGYAYYPKFSEIPLPEGMIYANLDSSAIVSLYNTSKVTDWKYLSVYSENEFMREANHIRTFIAIVVGVGLLLGMTAAYFLSRKVYSPIHSLFSMLSQSHPGKDEKGNEMDFIHSAVSQTLDKNRDLTLKVERHLEQQKRNSPYLKNIFLLKLLRSKGEVKEEWYSYLQSFGIAFPYSQFAVILYHVDDCSGFIEENKEDEWTLVRTAVSSVTEEIAALPAYTAECALGEYAVILNLPSELSHQLACERLYQIVQQSKRFIEQKCRIFLSVGIGSPCCLLSNVAKSYEEAEKALAYRIVRHGAIITFNEIESRSENYYYPLDLELQLTNAIKSGNSENCGKILDKIMDENINRRQISYDLARCLFFDLMGTAVKILDSRQIQWQDLFGAPYHSFEAILSCETLDGEIQQIRNLYTRICDYIRSHQSSRQFQLVENVKKYIGLHFSDYELSQSGIAAQFGITPAYLSKSFKQETGENMVDYINRRRVEEIKKLLVETPDSLSSIAAQTGCASDKNLIRIFKIYEGITPGKYREMNKKGPGSQN